MGFTDRIKSALKEKGVVSEKDVGKYLSNIEIGANRMKSIIQHFREFSRTTEHSLESVNVNDTIDSSFLLFNEQLKLRDIEIKKELSENQIFVKGDKNRLEQVFVNLISNAKDAFDNKMSEESKTIFVRTMRKEKSIVVEFQDNGSGVANEDKDKIFDPFFTTKEVGKGTGLGLSIAHGIVAEHGGSISLSSQFNKGSVVTVTLPDTSLGELVN